jgi:hypothetical protein
MRVKVFGVLVISVMCGVLRTASASEPSCYRTAQGAAAQTGVRGVQGFRLESVRRDVFSGVAWATVRSCGHPEWPGTLVMLSAGNAGGALGALAGRRSEVAPRAALVLLAGARVQLVETSGSVRMEMSGIAQSSGAIGDRIRVRMVPVSGDGTDVGSSWSASERFLTGVIRSAGLVEVVE